MARNFLYTVLATSMVLLSSGCHKSAPEQYSRFHEDGRAKPTVAFVPVFNHSSSSLTWDVAEELTVSIREKFKKRNSLFLVPDEKVRSTTSRLDPSKNPFAPDIRWMTDAFREAEFVVFLDLIEHEEVPKTNDRYAKAKDSSADLQQTMRVRVVDLRDPTPRIILQEVIHDSHFIPRQFTQANFSGVQWGSPGYTLSPLGLAHEKISKEIATRIEDYISLAKSR